MIALHEMIQHGVMTQHRAAVVEVQAWGSCGSGSVHDLVPYKNAANQMEAGELWVSDVKLREALNRARENDTIVVFSYGDHQADVRLVRNDTPQGDLVVYRYQEMEQGTVGVLVDDAAADNVPGWLQEHLDPI